MSVLRIFAISFFLHAWAPAAHAQSTERSEEQEKKEAEARTIVRRGLAAHARGDHASALQDYDQARQLVPDANLPWLYRAEALRSLGRYEEAVESYEHYLSMDPTVSDAAAVRSKIQELKALSRGEIALESTPAGAVVRDLDLGTTLGKTPTVLKLARGRYRLELTAEGFARKLVEVDVARGERQRIALSLDALASKPNKSSSPCLTRRVLGGVGGGLGVLTLGLGVVLDAVVANGAKNDFETARASGQNEAASDANGRYERAGTGAGVAYVVGGVLTAAGAGVALWPCPRQAVEHARSPLFFRF